MVGEAPLGDRPFGLEPIFLDRPPQVSLIAKEIRCQGDEIPSPFS
jgi:hypothetical protein